MSSQFTPIVIADPSHLKEYYRSNRHIMGMLEKCNSQEFYRGGKIGYGYFLTTKDKYNGEEDILITMYGNERGPTTNPEDPKYVEMKLTVISSMEIDGDHIILHTAEPKVKLQSLMCGVDYNVVNPHLLFGSESGMSSGAFPFNPEHDPVNDLNPTERYIQPKTWDQIITHIVDNYAEGFTLGGSDFPQGPATNVRVSGMTVLDALEYITRANADVFYIIGYTIYLNRPTAIFLHPLKDYETKEVSDVRKIKLTVSFPIYRTSVGNGTFNGDPLLATYTYTQGASYEEGARQYYHAYYPFAYEYSDPSNPLKHVPYIDPELPMDPGQTLANRLGSKFISVVNQNRAKKTYIVNGLFVGRTRPETGSAGITRLWTPWDWPGHSSACAWSKITHADNGEQVYSLVEYEPQLPLANPEPASPDQNISLFAYRYVSGAGSLSNSPSENFYDKKVNVYTYDPVFGDLQDYDGTVNNPVTREMHDPHASLKLMNPGAAGLGIRIGQHHFNLAQDNGTIISGVIGGNSSSGYTMAVDAATFHATSLIGTSVPIAVNAAFACFNTVDFDASGKYAWAFLAYTGAGINDFLNSFNFAWNAQDAEWHLFNICHPLPITGSPEPPDDPWPEPPGDPETRYMALKTYPATLIASRVLQPEVGNISLTGTDTGLSVEAPPPI